ncbi:TlpA disulfide reductase family protein [Paraglaciecola aestuariivivens]
MLAYLLQAKLPKLTCGLFKWLAVALLLVGCSEAPQQLESKALKDFSLFTESGESVSLHQQKGKVVLINFWASWCAPCLQEFPFLQQLQQEYAAQDLTVLAINLDQNSEDAKSWLNEVEVDFTILFDPQSKVSQKLNVQVMPTSILLDKEGKQRFIFKGYKPSLQKQYHQAITQLLSEQASTP